MDLLPDFDLPKMMRPLGSDLSRMMEGDLTDLMGPLGGVLQVASGGTGTVSCSELLVGSDSATSLESRESGSAVEHPREEK